MNWTGKIIRLLCSPAHPFLLRFYQQIVGNLEFLSINFCEIFPKFFKKLQVFNFFEIKNHHIASKLVQNHYIEQTSTKFSFKTATNYQFFLIIFIF